MAAPVGWTGPVVPCAAGLAVLAAATSLSGVIGGVRWLVFVAVTIAVIAGTGIALRTVRTPTPLVALGQFVGLLCFLTAVFTRSGILVVLPGPAALTDLVSVLRQAMEQVKTGIPPVSASAAILCLVCVALGMVAIVVDTLAVAAAAPAASGLVLLCVFAVPASLADDLLPWWAFAIGAAGFALLLVVDERQRHRLWRGRLGLPELRSGDGSAPAAAGIAASSVVVALLAGAVFTVVGTAGRLPGGDSDTGTIGLSTMANLRGLLNRSNIVELFRVRNLPKSMPYLRAVTLSQYDPAKGFGPDGTLDAASTADLLPLPLGTDLNRLAAEGTPLDVQIEPVGYKDYWLPVYGLPTQFSKIEDAWSYSPSAGIVHARTEQRAGPYRQVGILPNPSAESMRAAQAPRQTVESLIGTKYYEATVDQRVRTLAQDLTRNARTDYDRTMAIRNWLHKDGGFRYRLATEGTGQGDPLVDFLFNGKTGFCEQFASSMAAMLRAVNVPSRVAVGFTSGYANGNYQSITTNDAHAWVEVFFNGLGWVPFDPTPFPDDRGTENPYEQPQQDTTSGAATPTPSSTQPSQAPTTSSRPADAGGTNTEDPRADSLIPIWVWFFTGPLALLALGAVARGTAVTVARRRERETAAAAPGGKEPPELWWAVAAVTGTTALLLPLWFVLHPVLWLLVLLAVVAGCALAVPSWLRRYLRDRRLHAVALGGPDAAGAAWQELMAASRDRGAAVAGTETVRAAARKLVREHKLDEQGQNGLRTIIGAVERSWYGGDTEAEPELFTAIRQVLASMSASAPLSWRSRLFPPSVLRTAR